MDKFAFQPFGFAGKRICPGYRFAYAETSIFLAVLCRAFKFNVVEGQVVEPVFGLVTYPRDDIWVTLEKRQIMYWCLPYVVVLVARTLREDNYCVVPTWH